MTADLAMLDGLDLDAMLAEAQAELARRSADAACRSLAEAVRQAWLHVEGTKELAWNWHLDAVCDHIQAQLEDWAAARRVSARDWGLMVERATQTAVLRAQNQVINLPPRCLKTIIITVIATAWAWIHWPDMKIMTFSSNPRVTAGASLKFVKLVQTSWYRTLADHAADARELAATGASEVTGSHRWTVPEDPAAKAVINSAGGERHARGMKSAFTGEGFDWLLSDDPHNANDVFSDAKRSAVLAKWEDEVFNRVNDPTRSIRTIVMQRLHVDDLSAHVFAELEQVWRSLVLAMEHEGSAPVHDAEARAARAAAANDNVGTWLGWHDPRSAPGWAAGPILHPERFPAPFVSSLKRRWHRWITQYQQRPDVLAGGMFPPAKWRWWIPSGFPTPARPRPDGCASREESPARIIPRDDRGNLAFEWVCLSVDATVKKTDDGSRVGLWAVGGIGEDRFVIHDASRRMDYPGMKRVIRALVNADGIAEDVYQSALAGARKKLRKVLIEDKANGPAVIADLREGSDGGKWPPGVTIVPIETGADSKMSRASLMSEAQQDGHWYLLDGASWVDGSCGDLDDRGVIHEFSPFPNGKRDDRVDTAAQVENYYSTSGLDRVRALAGVGQKLAGGLR